MLCASILLGLALSAMAFDLGKAAANPHPSSQEQPPTGSTATAQLEGNSHSNLRHRQLFSVDGVLAINNYPTFSSSNLFAFDSTMSSETTHIAQIEQDPIPSYATVRCRLSCTEIIGTAYLGFKYGSMFTSETDGTFVSSSDGCAANIEVLIDGADASSPIYAMAYVKGDGSLMWGTRIRCESQQLPSGYDFIYFDEAPSYDFNLLSYDSSDIMQTTRQFQFIEGTVIPPVAAGTTATCNVTCEAGAGIAEIKYGLPFAAIGEGNSASSTSDTPCPFSVAATTTTDQPGYLLIYSLNSVLVTAEITCTKTAPSESPSGSPSALPSECPSALPPSSPSALPPSSPNALPSGSPSTMSPISNPTAPSAPSCPTDFWGPLEKRWIPFSFFGWWN